MDDDTESEMTGADGRPAAEADEHAEDGQGTEDTAEDTEDAQDGQGAGDTEAAQDGQGDGDTEASQDALDAEDAQQRAELPATGEPRVDDAVRRIAGLAGLPVTDHPPVFERVHGQLVDVLGELRQGPDPGNEAQRN